VDSKEEIVVRARLRSQLTYANVVTTIAVVAAVGGAIAYADGPWVNGTDVVNGSLTGTDVENNSIGAARVGDVGSGDVRDGALRAGDFADGALDARRGYRGDRGPQGDTGPHGLKGPQGFEGPRGDRGYTGAQGPRGDRGPKGLDGTLHGVHVVTGPSGQASPGGTTTATAPCPEEERATAGGAVLTNAQARIYESYPDAYLPKAWHVSISVPSSASGPVTVTPYVMCAT
jgi:hypothetical protein